MPLAPLEHDGVVEDLAEKPRCVDCRRHAESILPIGSSIRDRSTTRPVERNQCCCPSLHLKQRPLEVVLSRLVKKLPPVPAADATRLPTTVRRLLQRRIIVGKRLDDVVHAAADRFGAPIAAEPGLPCGCWHQRRILFGY